MGGEALSTERVITQRVLAVDPDLLFKVPKGGWNKVAAAVHEADPNQEMIDADHFEEEEGPPVAALTPMDAIETVGKALTVTQTVHSHRLGLINYFDKEYLGE